MDGRLTAAGQAAAVQAAHLAAQARRSTLAASSGRGDVAVALGAGVPGAGSEQLGDWCASLPAQHHRQVQAQGDAEALSGVEAYLCHLLPELQCRGAAKGA